MPVYLAPGVYVQEEERGPKSIQGVSTNRAAFIGAAKDGPPLKPTGIDSFDKFERIFGGVISADFPLGYAVRGFFDNGGTYCYVARMSEAKQASLDFEDASSSPKTVFTLKARNYGKNGNKINATLTNSTNDSLTKEPVKLSYMDGGAVPVEELLTGNKKLVVDYPLGSIFRFLAGDNVSYEFPTNEEPAKILSTKLSTEGDEEYVVTLDKKVDAPGTGDTGVLGLGLIDVDSVVVSDEITILDINLKYDFEVGDIVYFYYIDGTDASAPLDVTESATILSIDTTTDAEKTTLELDAAITYNNGSNPQVRLMVEAVEVSGSRVKLGKGIEVNYINKGDDLLYVIATDIMDINTINHEETAKAVSTVKAPKYEIELDTAVTPDSGAKVVIKPIKTDEVKIRVQTTLNIFKGSIVKITSPDTSLDFEHYDIVVDKTADTITLETGLTAESSTPATPTADLRSDIVAAPPPDSAASGAPDLHKVCRKK